MFVDRFIDPDLRLETFFEKDRAAENRGVDLYIWNIGTSAQLH